MTDHCAIPGCRGDVDVVYLDRDICQTHWDQLTAEDQSADALARALGIPVAETTTTEKTMGTKQVEGKEPTAKRSATEGGKPHRGTKEPKVPAEAPKPEQPTATEGKKELEVAKETTPKKERAPKKEPPPRVFAFRLDDAELEAIHATAGPRNASRFIRAVAAAFAAEDEGAFKAVLKEAKEARA